VQSILWETRDSLLGQSNKILKISDSEAGLKMEKSGGVIGEEGECEDAEVVYCWPEKDEV